MCGRYSQTLPKDDLQKRFGFKESHLELRLRYNIAPGQKAPVVVDEGQRVLRLMRWGLAPSWMKDPQAKEGLINARAETLLQKPSFKKPFLQSRCLVLADGFYEWVKREGGRTKAPMRFVLKTREPFAFAGLWDLWTKRGLDGFRSFTIVTTKASGFLASYHERMPVILRKEDEALWLDPDLKDPEKLNPMLQAHPADEMGAYEGSALVNSPLNDVPACLDALASFGRST